MTETPVARGGVTRRVFVIGGACVVTQCRNPTRIIHGRNFAAIIPDPTATVENGLTLYPPTEDDYLLYDDPAGPTRFISASDLSLTDGVLDPLKNLIVNADTVSISQPVSLPGRDIAILCRRLKFDATGELITTGADGKGFNDQDSAAIPTAYGQPGADGAPGVGGRPGGNIRIYAEEITGALKITARGGKGGHPQNGGDGSSGAPGATGAHVGDQGTPGGPGGEGGRAGVPGDGGPGGVVELATNSTPQSTWSHDTSSGDPGTPAHNGEPGQFGVGGPGHAGTVRVCDER